MNDPYQNKKSICCHSCQRDPCCCAIPVKQYINNISLQCGFFQYQVITVCIPEDAIVHGPHDTNDAFTYSQYWLYDGFPLPSTALIIRAWVNIPDSTTVYYDSNEYPGYLFYIRRSTNDQFQLIFPTKNVNGIALNQNLLNFSVSPPLIKYSMNFIYIVL